MAQQGRRVVVGSDDAGVQCREALTADLEADDRVAEVVDVGVDGDGSTAYPHVAVEAARRVAAGEADRTLLVRGTGLGVAISADTVRGVRAVTAHDRSLERAVLSTDGQVLRFGQRVVGLELARRLAGEWLGDRFDTSSASAAEVDGIRGDEAAAPATPHDADLARCD